MYDAANVSKITTHVIQLDSCNHHRNEEPMTAIFKIQKSNTVKPTESVTHEALVPLKMPKVNDYESNISEETMGTPTATSTIMNTYKPYKQTSVPTYNTNEDFSSPFLDMQVHKIIETDLLSTLLDDH